MDALQIQIKRPYMSFQFSSTFKTSAQEVIHLLMSCPLYHSSRTFVTLVIQEEDWSPVEVLLKNIFIINVTIQILIH